MGDINPSTPFYSQGLNVGITYRYNLNERYVLKGEASYLQLSAKDGDFSDKFQQIRGAIFSSQLYDFAIQFEFNFLPLKFVERKISFSPFLSTGIGCYDEQYVGFKPVLPAALGVRTALGRRWSIGLQWNMRKTFTDKLDNVTNMIPTSSQTILNNNDWYFITGLFLTYKVFDFPKDCSAYKIDQ